MLPPSLLCLHSDCLHSPPSWSPHMWADNSPPRTWEAAAPESWSPLWRSPGTCVHAEVTAPRVSDGGDEDIRHAEWNNPPRRAREGSVVPTAYGPTIPDCPGKSAEGIDGRSWCCCCFGCSIAGLHHTGSLHNSAQPRRRNSQTLTQHSVMSLFSCFYHQAVNTEHRIPSEMFIFWSYLFIQHTGATIPDEPPSDVWRL